MVTIRAGCLDFVQILSKKFQTKHLDLTQCLVSATVHWLKGSEAKRRIRALARSGRIFVDDHAWAAMEEHCVPFADLRHALEHAESCRSQPNARWHVVGRDPDGDVLRVIVELHDDLLVITVYRGDE